MKGIKGEKMGDKMEVELKFSAKNGITLIALVITIIVLLILAGVAILTLTGEDGMITRAAWSKWVTEYRTIEEAIKMCNKYDEETYRIEQAHLGNPINEDNLRYLNDFKYKTLEKFFKKLLQNT